ncbi:MAG: hypothetical protein ACAI44_08915 [Candidatus Sericytochromatia bacterium]
MTEIGLIMILAALWGAPSGAGQADFNIDFSGDQHRAIKCQGKVNFNNKPGAETFRFQQNCTGAGPQDENREVIVRFDQHKTYVLNHALKNYDTQELKDLNAVMQELIQGYDGKAETRPFLEGTNLWTQPTKGEFWITRIQDPAQQNRVTEVHLLAPGYGSHMYLSYAAAPPAADSFEPPKGYSQVTN